jgi:hypothetical protein
MAHEVIYKHPNDETSYPVDFTEDLTGDTSVSSSSVVTAVDSGGTDASSTIVTTPTRSGMVLTSILKGGTDGEDYRVTFTGRGTTTSSDSTRMVELRVRIKGLGNV